RKACVPTCLEVAPGLGRVEGAALEKDICRLSQRRSVGKHLGQHEFDVLGGVVEFGRHRVRAEPGRDAPLGADRPKLRQLRVAVEPVARLGLEGRRARAEHPATVTAHGPGERFLPGRPRRTDGREDAATGSMQLLVTRSAGSQGELRDPVAAEAGMRMAVDETGDRAEATSVELFDILVEWPEVAHPADRSYEPVATEEICILDQLDVREPLAAQWGITPSRRRELAEIADEERGAARVCRQASLCRMGSSIPYLSAVSRASS